MPQPQDSLPVIGQRDGKPLYRVWAKPKGGKRQSKTGTNQRELRKWKADIEAVVAVAVPVGARMTVNQFLDAYEDALMFGLKPTSINWYRTHFKNVRRQFGEDPIGRLDTLAVSEWVWSFPTKAARRSNYIAINKMLGWAVSPADLLPVNPCARMPARPPKTGRKSNPVVLLPGEIRKLADCFDERYRALIHLLGFCGPRIGEALGLKPENIDDNFAGFSVWSQADDQDPKTQAGWRWVPIMDPETSELLRDHVSRYSREYVFTTKRVVSDGKPMSYSGFDRKHWTPACAEFGRDLDIHDLRHTAVSMFVRAGIDPTRICSWVGHMSPGYLLETYSDDFARLRVSGEREQFQQFLNVYDNN